MLTQFLFNQDEEYHVRGLVRIMDEEINAIRRELQNLKEAGILISQKKGNKLFYKVDPNFMMIDELTKLLYKDRDDVRVIYKELRKVEGITTAALTINYLSGKHENDKDIDLLLLGTADVNSVQGALKNIEKALERELKVALLKNEDIEFQHKKRDEFLLNILRKDKIMLIGSDKDLI